MNLKPILMVCLIFFAFASTITTMTIAFGTWTPDVFGVTRTFAYNVEPGQVLPMGDPIDDEFCPG